jgi:ABC-type cobalamin/Fe3+-siderophores transport system ATPase subunit
MSGPAGVLRLGGVWRAFDRGRDRVSVLEDVSLTVAAGEVVAVVGVRDQGKTTLIRVASGMLPVDRGSVQLGGVELAGLNDRRLSWMLAREVGVAARTGPEVRVSVREYVELSLVACRRWRRGWRWWRAEWGRRERRLRVTAVLEELGLGGCADLGWEELSNWQRVLVELAQAVVVRPKLLLVDDVMDGFGLGKKQAAMDLLEGFAHDTGCGVLMAVSDHASALRSDRVWQLSRGKLKLMADHTHTNETPSQVIPIRRRHPGAG